MHRCHFTQDAVESNILVSGSGRQALSFSVSLSVSLFVRTVEVVFHFHGLMAEVPFSVS